jgi:hypothetical protein
VGQIWADYRLPSNPFPLIETIAAHLRRTLADDGGQPVSRFC